ncbi:hypothetical protein B0I35DRAFT_444320 [Stachybotrys elegans]|uniref:DUF7708 domain-containing protein n=1 Tax=Stachybotrys elegans TaxID=80388 RepID=A0A8K0SEF3_9HYPO|nr:hypothetical protein B0I35DRAFT_444320 [Stachybotrys elegans]
MASVQAQGQPWFAKGSTVGNASPAKLQKEHGQFVQHFSKILKRKHELASTKAELLQRIQQVGANDSPGLGHVAAKQFESACEMKLIHAEQRTSGIGVISTNFQDSFCAVARFAAAYSSILDLVSSAAGPYTSIGYQTISILFKVVERKRTNDDKLHEHFEQIQKMIPRLPIWDKLYPTDEMKDLVGNIYHLVIEFSRAAAKYLCMFWKRVRLALNPISPVMFDQHAGDIYKCLAHIRALADLKLHESISNMRKDMEESKLHTQTLVKAEQQRLEREDKRNFNAFAKLLGVPVEPQMHPGLCLRAAKQSLQSAFPNVEEYSPYNSYSHYLQMTPARIVTDPSFRGWDAPGSPSSVLFIHGETQDKGRVKGAIRSPCWLSPAAVHIAEHVQNHGSAEKRHVVFFSCCPDSDSICSSAIEVLSVTAVGLVEKHKAMLRDHLDTFRALLDPLPLTPSRSTSSLATPNSSALSPYQAYTGAYSERLASVYSNHESLRVPMSVYGADKAKKLRALTHLLSKVLDGLSHKDGLGEVTTNYIVIDRLDLANDNDTLSIHVIMEELVELVRIAKCRVKIAVVVEAAATVGKWGTGAMPDDVDRRTFTMFLNQRILTLNEQLSKLPKIWED